MLGIESASKYFGERVILEDQTWILPNKGVVGLVGVNGAGKTTLLRILAGEGEVDKGRCVRPNAATVGYLPQELAHSMLQGTMIETVIAGRQDLLDMETKVSELAERMHDEDVSHEYTELQARFEMKGGYTFRSTAREISSGLGFSTDDFDRPIHEFSGGWQMRALLAQLLLNEPDLLLMDEPTNHLDMESVDWLEGYLKRYPGCVVLVSHDRYFLNRMVTHVAELGFGKITTFKGNYDAFLAWKAEETERQMAAAARQQREINKVEKFIERFRYKNTKAKQVQSRVKSLEKLDIVQVDQYQQSNVDFRFPQPPRLGRIVAELKDVEFGYNPEQTLYKNFNFCVERKQRVALVGPNGAGKSTLLKMLAQKLKPRDGSLELGNNVETSYFAQHALDELNPDATVLAEVERASTPETAPQVRDILGAFGFSGDDVTKPVKVLSGGEKNRLALARLLMKPGGLLLLDEPTNHLDVRSREVLEAALQDFDGAVVTVSHDRFFINQVATHTVHVEDGAATTYLGDYDYYHWKREEEGADAPETASTSSDTVSRKDQRRAAAEQRAALREATKDLRAEIKRIEARIEELEALHETLMTELQDPKVYSDPELGAAKNKELKAAEAELEECMMKWEEDAAKLEEIEAEFNA